MTRYACPENIEGWLREISNGAEAPKQYSEIFNDHGDHNRWSIYITEYMNADGDVMDTNHDNDMECTYCGRNPMDRDNGLDSTHDLLRQRVSAMGYDFNMLCETDEIVYESEAQHRENCTLCPADTEEEQVPRSRFQESFPPRPATSLHSQWAMVLTEVPAITIPDRLANAAPWDPATVFERIVDPVA